MLDFPRWKTIGISIILLLGILFSIPTFLPQKTFDTLPGFAQIKVNLGLDLAGGSHLLLEADLADLNKTQLTNMEKAVRAAMRAGLHEVPVVVRDLPADPSSIRGGGAGRELIERALPYQLDATTDLTFGPEGISCRIELPLREPVRK